MSELDDSFAKLLGKQPSDAERQNLYRVRDALGLKNNDALWLVLMALQHYEQLYAGIPADIDKAAEKAAASAAAQAQADVNRAVAGLIPSVKEAVKSGAREALALEALGKSMFTLAFASVLVGLVFGGGLLYGARIIDAAEAGHLTWGQFWSQVGWILGLGTSVPGLMMLAVADIAETTQWWQWAAMLISVIIVATMVYNVVFVV